MNSKGYSRLLVLGLLVAFLIIGFTAYAATTIVTTARKARTASVAQGIEQVVGIGELQGGDALEIDNEGSASVKEYPKHLAVIGDANNELTGAGTNLVATPCRVHTITYGGPQAGAGDYFLLYDALTVTGTPKFDISVGTNYETKTITIPGGAIFSTGLTAVGGNLAAAELFITIAYTD